MAGELSDAQKRSIHLVSIALGTLSIISSFAVVVFHVRFRRSKRHFDDPILWLAVACLFAPLFNMGIGSAGNFLCAFEAMGNQFFYLASFVWVSCIAHQLYQIVVRSQTTEHNRYSLLYHLLGWGLPSLSVAVLLLAGQFETQPPDSYDWCWLQPGPWRFALFYIPLLIIMTGNLILYGYIVFTVYRKYRAALGISGRPRSSSETQRFWWQTISWGLNASLYVIVFIVSRIGSIANRFQELAHPDDPIFALRMLHAVSQALQGFLYAAVYAVHEGLLPRLKVWLLNQVDHSASGESGALVLEDYSYPYEQDEGDGTFGLQRYSAHQFTNESEDEYSD